MIHGRSYKGCKQKNVSYVKLFLITKSKNRNLMEGVEHPNLYAHGFHKSMSRLSFMEFVGMSNVQHIKQIKISLDKVPMFLIKEKLKHSFSL